MVGWRESKEGKEKEMDGGSELEEGKEREMNGGRERKIKGRERGRERDLGICCRLIFKGSFHSNLGQSCIPNTICSVASTINILQL